MNANPDATARTHPDPADSVLLSLARAVAGERTGAHAPSWPQLDLSDPQQREFGDYELLEEIGRGGMGVVYRARQRSLDRDVAIKFIADWFADPTGVARFLAEARAAARLLHPNIVQVHEVGTVEGMHYFSMPLIQGQSLADVLERGPMQPAAAIALLLKLCEAIDYAHRLGLLHLDLKPANVLIDARGEPLVADFGLARHMDDKGGVDAQEVSGTPAFMAPEQILIKQYRLTPATDIYALGALLYRCLTGVSPHGEGNPDDVIRRAAAGRIRPPRDLDPKIPRDIDAICMKCLELQPSDRYASVAQLADDLRRARDGLPVSVRRVGFAERAQRWVRREPRLAAAIAITLLASLAGAAATTWQWREAAAQRDRASVAGEIGAHLYAYEGRNDGRANDLLEWLRKRLPDNEERQTDALQAFTASLRGQSPEAADLLGFKIIQVLGSDYRREMIRALKAGSDPYRHFYAALLASTDVSGKQSPEEFINDLKASLAEHPGDPLLWQVAAVHCEDNAAAAACPYPRDVAAKELVRLDEGNMYSWLLLAIASGDAQHARAAVHEAARRNHFNDYLGASYAAYDRAVRAAAAPVPELLHSGHAGIAVTGAELLPLAHYQFLIDQCGIRTGAMPSTDPELVSDCLVIGETMMRSNAGLMSRMIGVTLVKTLAKGKPEADEATRIRRLYTWLDDGIAGRANPELFESYPAENLLRDSATIGQMGALQRRARFLGLPDQPPADWKPAYPLALQSTRERIDNAETLNRDAAKLIAEGKYADAVAVLAPADRIMSTDFFKDDWRRVRYLTLLAEARIGLHDFAAAQASLEDAQDLASNFGPSSLETRNWARAFMHLYSTWNAAEPGKGYGIKADDWQRRLEGLEAAKDD